MNNKNVQGSGFKVETAVEGENVQGSTFNVLTSNNEPRTLNLNDLLGKSFAYGGRGPFEYDCYGLVMEIYKRRGVALPDFGSSPSASWIHRMITEGKKLFIELKAPEPFCLVTFALRPPYTTHIGVVLEDGYRFMHIMQKSEVTIERLDGVLWKRKITGYFTSR